VAAGVVVLILAGLTWRGCGQQVTAVPWASGTTIIPGQFGWDAETDSIVDPLRVPVADFWWEMVSETQRYLTPINGTVAAVVKSKSYEQIDATFVARRHLRTAKIDGGDKAGVLDPDTVIVFCTADGTLGKLQIVGYRRLHDLSFPQASAYPDTTKSSIAQHTNIERGHLEVKWQLYRQRGSQAPR
jgi:hypothetical protein